MNTTKITVNLDEDVADVLKERASIQNKPFEQVVNEALRRDVLNGAVGEKARPVYAVKPDHSGFAYDEDPKKYKQFLNDEDDKRYLRLTYGEDRSRWPAWLRERWGISDDDNEGCSVS